MRRVLLLFVSACGLFPDVGPLTTVSDASTLRTLMRNIAKIQGVYDVERV